MKSLTISYINHLRSQPLEHYQLVVSRHDVVIEPLCIRVAAALNWGKIYYHHFLTPVQGNGRIPLNIAKS